MKVMFIESCPSIDWDPSSRIRSGGRRHPSRTVEETTYSPINLSCAAVLRDNSHEVFYIHAQADEKTVIDIEKDISRISPDLLVFDVHHIKMVVDNYLSEIAHKYNIKTLWVGSFATPMHKELIKNPNVDFILCKEWDYSVLDLIKNWNHLEKVRGLTYKVGKSIKINQDFKLLEDLDSLPIPAYDLVAPLERFKEAVFLRSPCATVFSSRGCPFNCVFCTFINSIFSRKPRGQSPERVIEEARYLIDNFKISEIRYDDDLWEFSRKRALRICELFKKEDLDLVWSNQMRPDLDKEMAQVLSKAGCHKTLFGVESGSDYVLKMMRKAMMTDRIRLGQRNTRDAGITRHNCFLLGSVWDTKETTKQTIDFAFELNAEFSQFAIMTGFPGCDYYDMVKPYMVTHDWSHIDSFHEPEVDLPNLPRKYLEEQLAGIYGRYYLRKEHMWMMLKRAFRSTDHLKQTLRLVKIFYARKREGYA